MENQNRGIIYLIGIFLMVLIACQKDAIPPSAFFSVFPAFGDARTVFYFDATKSSDTETINAGLQVRWDWEGDSIWDTSFSSEMQVAKRFDSAGWYFVTMQVKDNSGLTATYRDTFEVWSSIPKTGELIDSRDGQKYNTVKFRDIWVMSENLKYGTWISDSILPTQNNVPEYYLYENDPDNVYMGGLYTWQEMINYKDKEGGQGICPDGWHIPTFQEYNELFGFRNYDFDDLSPAPMGPIPINMDYYFGGKSFSGLNIEFYGFGIKYYPNSEEPNEHRDFGFSVGYWTSHPLITRYNLDGEIHLCTNVFLSIDEYHYKWSRNRFDLAIQEQRELFLSYVRCFKDQ